jgi:hypothetical protein
MKKIYKYFLITSLIFLLVLPLAPKFLGENALSAGVWDAAIASFKAVLGTVTGGTAPGTSPTTVTPTQINQSLDSMNTFIKNGALKKYTPKEAQTALDAALAGIDVSQLPNNTWGNAARAAIKAAYTSFTFPLTLPTTLTNTATQAETSLKPFDFKLIGSSTTGYNAKIIIPCNTNIAGGSCPSQNTPAGYIARLYQFGLMIVGLVAFGAIIYGAVLYTLSAGNVGNKEDAKDQMLQAVLGLLLLLGAYLLLYTINPNLVNLINPVMETPESSTEQYKSSAKTNTPSENSGAENDGCEVSSSGAFDNFLTVSGTAGDQQFNTGEVNLKCTKCMGGNNLNSQGDCDCKVDLTRRFNGMCCKSTEAIYKGACTSCSHFTLNFSDSDISALSSNEKSGINESCGINLCGANEANYLGICRTCDQTLAQEIAKSMLSKAKKAEIYTRCKFK